MSTLPNEVATPHLKLFLADETDSPFGGKLSPAMTLSQFFDHWFLPHQLRAERRDVSTIKVYQEAINYWITLTADPPLGSIDRTTISQFKERIAAAKFRRGPLAAERTISKSTAAKHLRSIRAILYRAGPPTDPKRLDTTSIIGEVPHMSVGKPFTKRKKCFDLETARAIIDASYHLEAPRKRRKVSGERLGQLMRAIIYGLYYIGERSSTMFLLRRSWIDIRGDGPWFEIPGEAVAKTEKPLEIPIHADLLVGLDAVRTGDDLLINWPHSYSFFGELHERLQLMAGVPKLKLLPPHAWRRTHGKQLGLLGAEFGMEAVRRGLNHADVKTTEDHYVSLDAELVRKLPSIRVDHDGQMRLF